jgi:hypothetical protein
MFELSNSTLLIGAGVFALFSVWFIIVLWKRIQVRYRETISTADGYIQSLTKLETELRSIVIERQQLMTLLLRRGDFPVEDVKEWMEADETAATALDEKVNPGKTQASSSSSEAQPKGSEESAKSKPTDLSVKKKQ